MKKEIRIFSIMMMVMLLLTGLFADQIAADEVIFTQEDGFDCVTVTFEGLDDFSYIHPENDYRIEGSGTRFEGWVSVTSAGIPTPSGVTLVFTVPSHVELPFDEPVSKVSFFYTSQVGMTLQAYDAEEYMVAVESFPANDLSGNFEIWDLASIESVENNITNLRVNGAPGYFAIDDLKICRKTDREVPVDIKPRSCPNKVRTRSARNLPVAILGTEDIDVADINAETIRLEGIAPVRSRIRDVARPFEPYTGKTNPDDCNDHGSDGFDDLLLKFDICQIEEILADVNDNETAVLKLTAELKDGTLIHGEDIVIAKKKDDKKNLRCRIKRIGLDELISCIREHRNWRMCLDLLDGGNPDPEPPPGGGGSGI